MKLSKLKLTQLNNVELRKEEMGHLVGAESCGCGCNETSTTYTNANANWNKGYSQSSGGNKKCASWNVDTEWKAHF